MRKYILYFKTNFKGFSYVLNPKRFGFLVWFNEFLKIVIDENENRFG